MRQDWEETSKSSFVWMTETSFEKSVNFLAKFLYKNWKMETTPNFISVSDVKNSGIEKFIS